MAQISCYYYKYDERADGRTTTVPKAWPLLKDGRLKICKTDVLIYMQRTRYKKSELMLMRRARAYSSSCSHVVLVYLHPFRGNSLFCSRKSQKKSLNTSIFGVQGHSKSSMLIPLRSSLPCSACYNKKMSVPMCNHFHARQANNGKITTLRNSPLWFPRAQASLNVRVQNFDC